ncbi:AMP-binding protein, partial [Escherichia coli]|uniref:AMP-binding protein n=1 Tax=Escherichia coli TaxID=562 RepID=UPI000FB1561B
VGATLADAIPGLTLIYADEGETPEGMENYETLITRSEPIPDAMRTRDDLAGIFYTGGTTGLSKGATLLHRNVVANILQVEAWFQPMLAKLPQGMQLTNVCALPL